MFFAVLADVAHVKFLRHLEIELDRAALPRTTEAVLEMEVDLWTVEGAVARVDDIVLANRFQRHAQAFRRFFPELVRAHGIFRTRRQLDVIFKAEFAVDAVHKLHNADDLVDDLVFAHVDVGIVLRERAHAHQPVERARKLVTVNKPQLSPAQRQFAIAVQTFVVEQNAARAVHWLDGVWRFVDLREVHVFLVMIPVARAFPQRAVHDQRRADLTVASLIVLFAPEFFQLFAQDHTFWMEDREAWRFFHEGEEIQFLTQLAMVAALRFFQQVQVFIQRFLLRETRAVDALQHFVVFITAPVCTGNAHELDRLDHARFWQMWASAEIHILAVLIEADRFIFRQIFDKLHLVGFAAVGKEFDRFFARQLLAFKHSASLDDLLHFLFDLVQIFRHKRVRAVKVIVKTVFDR